MDVDSQLIVVVVVVVVEVVMVHFNTKLILIKNSYW